MSQFDLKTAIQYGKGQRQLSNDEKTRWNHFIQFVADKGMVNHPDLDRRDKSVGMGLLQAYNAANPKMALDTGIVPLVQQSLQDYRGNLVNQWKSGKIQADGVKSADEIMPNLSAVDSWPGSKTLSHRFPIAVTTHSDGTVQNYGTDVAAYDKDRGIKK